MALVEVERLWIRFKQFDLNENGFLPKKNLFKSELNNDPFLRNVSKLIIRTQSNTSAIQDLKTPLGIYVNTTKRQIIFCIV